MLNTLIDVINRLHRDKEEEDKWIWRGTTNGIYTTKAAYEILTAGVNREENPAVEKTFKNIWRNSTPSDIA